MAFAASQDDLRSSFIYNTLSVPRGGAVLLGFGGHQTRRTQLPISLSIGHQARRREDLAPVDRLERFEARPGLVEGHCMQLVM